MLRLCVAFRVVVTVVIGLSSWPTLSAEPVASNDPVVAVLLDAAEFPQLDQMARRGLERAQSIASPKCNLEEMAIETDKISVATSVFPSLTYKYKNELVKYTPGALDVVSLYYSGKSCNKAVERRAILMRGLVGKVLLPWFDFLFAVENSKFSNSQIMASVPDVMLKLTSNANMVDFRACRETIVTDTQPAEQANPVPGLALPELRRELWTMDFCGKKLTLTVILRP